MRSCSIASSAISASSSPSNTLPVGLCGVFSRISFVRGPIAPPQLVGVEAVATVGLRCEQHRDRDGVGERDAGLIAVVHRLEQHDLVAAVEHAEQRSGQRFGRAGGDGDLDDRDRVRCRTTAAGGRRSPGAVRERRGRAGTGSRHDGSRRSASSSTSGGPSVSGKPCPRLIAPVARPAPTSRRRSSCRTRRAGTSTRRRSRALGESTTASVAADRRRADRRTAASRQPTRSASEAAMLRRRSGPL